MTGGEMSFDESIDCSVTGLAAKKQSSEEFRNTRNLLICSGGSSTQEPICQRNYFKMVREIFGGQKTKIQTNLLLDQQILQGLYPSSRQEEVFD